MLSEYFEDIFLLIWIGFMAFAGKSIKKQKITVLGHEEEHYGWFFAIVVFYPIYHLVVYAIMRGDTFSYIYNFVYLGYSSVSQVFDNWDNISKGPGFILLEVLIRKYVGVTFTSFRATMAILQSISLIFIYRKYSSDYIFSIFLFITSLSYEAWMMNGIRQFLAATLIFAATPLLLKKKYISLAIVVLVASTIHSSAMIIIPIFIVSIFKPWEKKTVLFLIAFSAVLYFYVSKQNYLSDDIADLDDGANPIRVFISLIPTFLAFLGRKKIEEKNNVLISICVNLSVITAIMYTVAVFTSGVTIGRLPGYTNIYNFILIPYLCTEVFEKDKSLWIGRFFVWFNVAYFFADLMFI